jgi:putative N6-adenine-specific DNA methylase
LNDQAVIYLDTSGETIAKHGYRKFPGKAPLMESLASAVLMGTTWDRGMPFVNPMCGSGTLAIEAALLARNIYPGQFRTNYGFMHTNNYRSEDWEKVKSGLPKQPMTFPRIIATDHDRNAIHTARKNAEAAGVADKITFVSCDFAETRLPEGPGVLILNPEYGERLGEFNDLENTYSRIGDFFKKKAQGYTGYIFTGNLDLAKRVGLRTKRRIPFFNARIECRLLEYELYSGSRKNEHK